MTARRKPLLAIATVLAALLVALLPSSAAAFGPAAGPALGQLTHHHLAMPGILRAEAAVHELQLDAGLWAASLTGLGLLGWLRYRAGRAAARPIALPIPTGRGPPPVR
ncbi:MAG TPA: hypothetical protein VFU36_06535 [Jatrophihabitans sp.]|nr:hypothetical protein [Jatrophihabitans sp.]